MVLISFENTKIIVFFKNLVFFYLTSLTFGGAAFMFIFFINPQNAVLEEGHFLGTYPIKMAFLGGILGLILIVIVSKIIKDKFKDLICDLEICYKGKKIKIKTLVDSRKSFKRTNIRIRSYNC